MHITLYRLEDKGLLTSTYGGASSVRGGRRKRYFQITNSGKDLLSHLQEQRTKLWQLMPKLKFGI